MFDLCTFLIIEFSGIGSQSGVPQDETCKEVTTSGHPPLSPTIPGHPPGEGGALGHCLAGAKDRLEVLSEPIRWRKEEEEDEKGGH